MNGIIELILGYFGYVKITEEVVMASIAQEDRIRQLLKLGPRIHYFLELLHVQELITNFLRAGRKISQGENHERNRR